MNKNEMNQKQEKQHHRTNIRWMLIFYDVCMYLLVDVLLLVLNPSGAEPLSMKGLIVQIVLGGVCIFSSRLAIDVYHQVWRYGGIQPYIRLLIADVISGILYSITQAVLPIEHIAFIRVLAIVCMSLLGSMVMRMVYHDLYLFTSKPSRPGNILRVIIHMLTGVMIKPDEAGICSDSHKIKIAIVGAGRVGVSLAEELLNNSQSSYKPICFIDVSKEKIGRQIYGIPVLAEEEASLGYLSQYEIQEIVFALPQIDDEDKKTLYEYYKQTGCRMKVYDYPTMQAAGTGKRHLREFDIEELLFRQPIVIEDERTSTYYKGKVILITGGGGSIGSELCRQIAKMKPKQLIILDVYENGAYDIQQELKIAYGESLDLCVEIVSVCDKNGLEKVFDTYQPQIVLHAAAHKHVPLMEHNCCEAVKNNVFGTLNTVELSEKYEAERFLLISTDKAVNPTNVMGATKRMCEMIVQSYSQKRKESVYSIVRFGNVLGSAGSVIPLFKRQIMNGGPVTLTDKRITRYFMTIPEASQLVLQSGAMAKNGELFVLDMGKPVKIIELAENMIRLSGLEPYRDIDIIETGLRPGEKLYEELLIKNEELSKTENRMIFIERDTPLSMETIEANIKLLKNAAKTENDENMKMILKKMIPSFKSPEEVNEESIEVQETRFVKQEKQKVACGLFIQ